MYIPPSLCMNSDSYKYSQYLQMPKGTDYVTSYCSPRGGAYTHYVNFGIQAFIKNYLIDVPTKGQIRSAARYAKLHGIPYNYSGWMQLNKLGYIPLKIDAVEEGTVLEVGNVCVQITNTHKDFGWLVQFVETAMLRAIWYTSTIATLSASLRNCISKYGELCNYDIAYSLVNFGDRGATSTESAILAGMAHLTSWLSTDSFAALEVVENLYDVDLEEFALGFSIPASEHSTITSWGKDNEIEAFRNMIDTFGGINPDGSPKIYACVSDSWNIWKACEMWYSLQDEIIEKGGRLVIRPDSGDPIKTPINVVKYLIDLFGYDTIIGTDGKEYKVLPHYIRVIQGDGVNQTSIDAICSDLIRNGISPECIAFGMGGELVQKVNRDTLQWAMKCCHIKGNSVTETNDGTTIIDSFEQNVYKSPIGTSSPDEIPTEDSFKKSKDGILALVKDGDDFKTIRESELGPDQENMLKNIYLNSVIVNPVDFGTIRSNLDEGFKKVKLAK